MRRSSCQSQDTSPDAQIPRISKGFTALGGISVLGWCSILICAIIQPDRVSNSFSEVLGREGSNERPQERGQMPEVRRLDSDSHSHDRRKRQRGSRVYVRTVFTVQLEQHTVKGMTPIQK